MEDKHSNSNIHAFIISWDGMHNKAKSIAEQIYPCVHDLHVVYSNSSNTIEEGPGKWILVDNSHFFGKKFQRCLECFSDGIFLLIHADADTTDWKRIIEQCQGIHNSMDVGVWSPDTYHTNWETERVQIAQHASENINFVAQTDGIVFSLNEKIIKRLNTLDYNSNNLGWGIDWAAICYAYCNNMFVVRDHNVFVAHKQGSGYNNQEAKSQMEGFLEQLTAQEKVMYALLTNNITLNTAIQKSK